MDNLDAITAAREAFVAAFDAGDVPALSAFVTEDTVGMPPNQPQIVGRDAARAFWREGFAMAKSTMTLTSPDFIVAGDVAVDCFDWAMKIVPHDGSAALQDNGEGVWIWRREDDGAWRLASSIWNSDLAEPGLWAGASRTAT